MLDFFYTECVLNWGQITREWDSTLQLALGEAAIILARRMFLIHPSPFSVAQEIETNFISTNPNLMKKGNIMLHMKAESSCQIQHGLQKIFYWYLIYSYDLNLFISEHMTENWLYWKLRHDFISIKMLPLVWMIGIESPLWIVWPLASIA